MSEWELCIKAASRGEYGVADSLTAQGKFALRAVGGVSELGRINQDDLRWAKKEFISAWKGWKPSAGSALAPASQQSALPSAIDSEAVSQIRSFTEKLSFNGRAKKKSPPANWMKFPVLVNQQHSDAIEVCHLLIAIILKTPMSDTLFDLSQYQSHAHINYSPDWRDATGTDPAWEQPDLELDLGANFQEPDGDAPTGWRGASEFTLTLQSGQTVEVKFVPCLVGLSRMHEFSFTGPVSSTGFKSHFVLAVEAEKFPPPA